MSKASALTTIARAAVQSEAMTGLPAELQVAQCAIESGWLDKAPGNNCYGIKYNPARHTGSQLMRTREWFTDAQRRAWVTAMKGREVLEPTGRKNGARTEFFVRDHFATFASLADCFAEHARLITQGAPYAKAWSAYQQSDKQGAAFEAFLQGISKSYASAPDYPQRVLAVLTRDVREAITAARS